MLFLLTATKFLFWMFWRSKIQSFLRQKFDGNMIFTDYWKVLIVNFSGMGNTVLLWAKMLMERWYLLITEKFLFWTFQWWQIRSFISHKFDGKMIFTWPFWAFHDITGLRKFGFSYAYNSQINGPDGRFWIWITEVNILDICNSSWWLRSAPSRLNCMKNLSGFFSIFSCLTSTDL